MDGGSTNLGGCAGWSAVDTALKRDAAVIKSCLDGIDLVLVGCDNELHNSAMAVVEGAAAGTTPRPFHHQASTGEAGIICSDDILALDITCSRLLDVGYSATGLVQNAQLVKQSAGLTKESHHFATRQALKPLPPVVAVGSINMLVGDECQRRDDIANCRAQACCTSHLN